MLDKPDSTEPQPRQYKMSKVAAEMIIFSAASLVCLLIGCVGALIIWGMLELTGYRD